MLRDDIIAMRLASELTRKIGFVLGRPDALDCILIIVMEEFERSLKVADGWKTQMIEHLQNLLVDATRVSLPKPVLVPISGMTKEDRDEFITRLCKTISGNPEDPK